MSDNIMVKIGADVSDFNKGMSDAQGSLKEFSGMQKNTSDAFKKVGGGMTVVGGALGGALFKAVKGSAEFEQQMSRVGAVSGATDDEMKKLKKNAEDLGGSTAYTAVEVAQAQEYMAQAGWKTNEIIAATGDVLSLASAGGLELGEAAQIVTETLNGFGKGADFAGEASDILSVASRSTGANVSELGEGLKYSASMMSSANMEYSDGATALGIFADNGIKGSRGGTIMNSMLRDMVKSAEDGKLAIGDTSVAIYDAEGNFRSFGDIVGDIEKATDGMSDSARNSAFEGVFQQRALEGVNMILDAGVDKYDELKKALDGSKGSAEEMREELEDNLIGQLTILGSGVDQLARDIGDTLVPHIKKAVDFVQLMIDKFNGLSDGTKNLIGITAGITAAFLLIGGPILIAIGLLPLLGSGFVALGVVMGAIVSIPGLIVLATVAAVVAIIAYWEPIKEFFSDLWTGIKEGALDIWESLPDSWDEAVELLKDMWDGVKDFFIELWVDIKEAFEEGWAPIAKLWDGLADKLEEPWDSFVEYFSGIWDEVKGIFDTIFDPLLEAWNDITEPLLEEVDSFIREFEHVLFNIGHTVKHIWEFISEIFEIGMDLLQPIVDVGMNAISWIFENVFGTIVIYLEEAWNVISGLFVTSFDIISEIVSGAFDTVLTVFKTTFELIENVVRGALSIIGGILDVLVGGFVIIFTTAWDAIGGVVMTAFDLLSRIIDVAAYAIQETLGQALHVIKALFTGDFDKIKESVSNAMYEIGEVIDHLTDEIVYVFTESLNAIKNLFSTVFGGIWEFMKHIGTSLYNVADRTVSMMYDVFDTVFGGIIDVVVGIWNTISEVFTIGGDGIVEAITNSIIGAINVLTDMKDKFFEGGKNILKSIGKGIAKGIGFVTGPMSDLAEDIRDFLPFSPAKKGALRDIMNIKIAESIGKSIDSGRATTISAMRRLSAGIHAESPGAVDMSYITPGRVESSYNSAVNGAVDISATKENSLLSEIRDQLSAQGEMILEIDGRQVGEAVRPHINQKNAEDDAFRKFK